MIDHNRQATLQVCGEMDAMSAPLLPTVVTRALPSGVGSVRLDLSRLSFCDAAGLRAVVEIHDQLGVRRVPLVLVGLRPKTRQLLAITGLDELLPLDDVLSVSRLGEVVHGPATVRQIS
ncbi:STAS domain-containing protein [uncultured Jatrophihabitans sp.]|uniref:STAS domain-containing protein n=1 Tax=uncultured Jatrophihabitans sp. TaxID=1610747 RepID=UPI0035CA8BFD